MKTVYGPVLSWRLGRSFGIDLICKPRKVCSFDCIYCQLGKTKQKTLERKVYVKTERILKDLNEALPRVRADVITFSGTGEPTLAKNLGEIIDFLKKKTNLPLAILTNSTLLANEKVKDVLNRLDIVVAKFDAFDEKSFKKIDNPVKGILFKEYFEGIQNFRRGFLGKFALQIMFVKENKDFAKEIANLAKKLSPDEIQINTPLRPCKAKPLNQKEIKKIKKEFSGFTNMISVYGADKLKVLPLDLKEIQKRKRPES